MTGGKGFKFTNNIPFICKFEIGNLMFGGPDNDKLFGSDGLDVMFGLGGADELWASNQVDVLFGNAGNDKIVAGDGGALFYILPSPGVTNGIRLGAVAFGGPDDDTIEGGNDIDLLFGGGGNDTARGSYSYDIFDYPNLGFECGVVDLSFDIDLLFGGGGNDTLDGGHDSDLIFGGPGDDTLLGNGETNKIAFPEIGLLFGGPDNDTVIGGTNDLLTLAFGGRGGDFIQGSSLGVMNLLFGSQDADTIDGYGDLLCLAFGGRDDDTVHGGGFVLDLLFGGKNDDTMHGKAGTLDLMFGNDGDDDMSGGNSVLNLMFGNQGNDTMRSGSSALGILFGNAGCDTMFNESLVGLAFGNREADALFGGPSLVEIFFGNDGEDYVEGGGLIDVLFGNGDNDTLRSGPVLSLVFGNSGHDTLHGSAVLDLLFGNTGNDHIYGNAGPDLIFGGQDNDKIDGGDWPDLIFGGPGQDILLGNDGLDLVFGGPDGDFIYGGSDTDLLFGGRGATGDTIDGGLWRDIIFGQKGVDYLDGGAEKDRIWGGQDTDYLVARGDDTRLRGNKGDDQFWIASGSGVRVHGGPGSDVYQGSPSKVTSASSGSVSFTFPVPACAEIHGTKWQDLNANGVRDPGEPGLVGVTITLNNGAAGATVTMADDPGTKADETGMYWFTLLPAGNYTVREIVPPGSVQTFPSGNAGHSVTLGVIDIATGRDFGNRPCAPPPSGLVMWLPLDENGGNVAHNRAGGLNGAHHNAPAVASGFVDRSRGYGASNQFTEVPSHGLITVGTNDFTLDAWVRRGPASGNGIEVIVDKRKRVSAPVIGTLGYSLFLYEGRLWCQLADGPHANYDSGLAVPADSQWHFVAVSVQRRATNGGRFHVDGATAPFNPTARTGSLDHAGHLGVGHSPLLADSGWFPGGIDEVELFNRALSAAELTEIFNAKWIGKCKLRCHLPAVASFCGNAQAVSIVAQLCNLSGMHDTFTYSFAGLPAGPGCDVAGPATFSPASGSVSLAPGACANIPVTIARPAGMGGPSSTLQTACYTFTLAGAESGMSMVCTGKLSRPPNGLCLDLPADTLADFPVHVTADGLPSLPGGSRDVAVPLRLANGGTNPASLTVVVRVVPADAAGPGAISLNGLPPGEPVIRGVTVPPGGTTNLDVRVELLRNDPYRHLTLLIEADLDGDGLPEPLRSVAVQEIVQGRMDIERVLFATPAPGGTSSRVPSVSWSGFGTLQSAPTLPVPWKDVPGNPGSPHTVTNPAAMTEFFRLRQ
jgi:Ca2+-binding RTX toxin-like protein